MSLQLLRESIMDDGLVFVVFVVWAGMRAERLDRLIIRSTSRYCGTHNGLGISFAQHQRSLHLVVGIFGVAVLKPNTHFNDG